MILEYYILSMPMNVISSPIIEKRHDDAIPCPSQKRQVSVVIMSDTPCYAKMFAISQPAMKLIAH
jgi:hypothetical protein